METPSLRNFSVKGCREMGYLEMKPFLLAEEMLIPFFYADRRDPQERKIDAGEGKIVV